MIEVAIPALLALWGTIVDLRYQKKGGAYPVDKDWFPFFVVGALWVLIMAGSAVMNGSPLLPWSVTLKLGLGVMWPWWEIERWRVRRKYPLSPEYKDWRRSNEAVTH